MATPKGLDRCRLCGRKQTRGNPANARLWLLYHAISEKLPVQGVTHSAETWHLYFKSKFLGCDEAKLPSNVVLQIPRSTAKLDVGAFSDYMQKVEVWANEHGVFLDEMFEA